MRNKSPQQTQPFMYFRVIVFCLLVCVGYSIFDITAFGAVPNSDTVRDQFANQQALYKAILAANASTDQRIVRIPDKKFYSMPVRSQNVHNITILIYGKWIASKNVKHWPKQPNQPGYYEDFISFYSSSYIEIYGGGKIDGRGYHWWILCLLAPNKYLKNQNYRPHLIHMINCNFTTIHDVVFKNSAQFHLKMDRCHDGLLYNIDIKVNTTAQINLIKKFSLEGAIIMFPFNTDGIDPAGARFHIYNITAQNWDDVVVPKPEAEIDCTRDFLVENCTVVLGVGMTVGSVPPNKGCNCVRNITFRNVRMVRPLKGIYVKTNPGDEGTGLIQDIYYGNFTMDRPVWWAIYIGPQQMKQPDGDGPGCMLYPFDKKGTCATQPRVTLKNITLQNIKIHRSLLYPYTIRCNVTNPCRDINFYNVQTDQWLLGQKDKGYVCEYAMGKTRGTFPPIHCLDDVEEELPAAQANPKMNYFKQPKSTIFDEYFERTMNGFKVSRMLFSELQKAALEVGYTEEDDDFDYEFDETGLEDLDIGENLRVK